MLAWSLKFASCIVLANVAGNLAVHFIPFMSFLSGPVVGFAILFVTVPYWQRTLKEVRAEQERDRESNSDT